MNENEIKRLQQEAVKRAREMQNIAKNNSSSDEHKNKLPEPKQPQEKDVHKENKQSCNTENGHSLENSQKQDNMTGGVFDLLMKDKEKTLILCLVLLLMDEKTDNGLLLALMYLLI